MSSPNKTILFIHHTIKNMFWPADVIKQRRSHNYAKHITYSVSHKFIYNI